MVTRPSTRSGHRRSARSGQQLDRHRRQPVIYRITSAFVHGTSNSLLMVRSGVAGVSEHGVAQAAVGMSAGRLVLLASERCLRDAPDSRAPT